MLEPASFSLSDNPFKNVIITADNFPATEGVLEIFNHSPKFIPVPNSCCHSEIVKGVNDFLRRYQWRFVVLSNTTSSRFTYRSGCYPSKELVPRHVLRKCHLIRSALSSLLKSCTNCFDVKDNLSSQARSDLRRLQSNSSVVISPVDKGGIWMVLPREDYEAEGLRQLSDTAFYASDCQDFTLSTKQRLLSLLHLLQKSGFLSKREEKALAPPSEHRDREFYLLPKAHKPTWSFPRMPKGRPIVSDTASVSRRCASFIEFFLAPLAQRSRSYLRDSLHLISKLDQMHVSSSTILFTMDIASLYTNIPLDDGLTAVSNAFRKFPDPRRPDLTLLTMLRLLLTCNDFVFLNRRFLQLQGTAMGCAFGASYANIFLAEWEERIFSYSKPPSHWFRYIDDCFGVWDHNASDLSTFFNFVTNLHPTIKVELVSSKEAIRFLDLELYVKNEQILYKIGFKPTDNHSILSPHSFHPPHVFRGILFSQVYRWATRSATYKNFKETKKIVQKRWIDQGYTRSKIRQAVRDVFKLTLQTPLEWSTGFFPCSKKCSACKYAAAEPVRTVSNSKLNSTFLIVHKLSCFSFNVIYLLTCTSCNFMYVGQTCRPLRMRIAEHVYNIKNCLPTPVSEHFNSSCTLQHFSFAALEHCHDRTKRLLKENKWIRRLRTLKPDGINEACNVLRPPLRLVLPFSFCSRKIHSLCRGHLSDVTVSACHTTSPNLRDLLRRGVKKRS